MTEQKQITVTVAGSGESNEVSVLPGDQTRDVLSQVVENQREAEYTLRRGDGEQVDDDVDLHETLEAGEATFAATEAVVGRR